MKNYQWVSYKYYNTRGQRLAIFGEETEIGKYTIKVISCSKKDQFSKKEAKKLFELGKGVVHYFNDTWKFGGEGFTKFCNQNYLKQRDNIFKVNGIIKTINMETSGKIRFHNYVNIKTLV